MSSLYDPVRGKNVKALPEERVRHQLVRWLTESAGVPARLVAVEYSLRNLDPGNARRADVVAWMPAQGEGGLRPWLLAECKAPGVPIDDAVADQVRRYAVALRARHVLLTNGEATRVFTLEAATASDPGRYREAKALPLYPG